MPDPSTLFGVDLESVRERLRELEYFTSVGDLQAGTEAISGLRADFLPPAAFVSIASEGYQPNVIAAGGFRQRAQPIISVLACIPAQRRDDELADEVEQARKVILAKLIGWQPDGAERALEAQGYSVRLIADGLVWIEWRFATVFHLAGNPGG